MNSNLYRLHSDRTASTGYLQRKMIKMVEDLKFDYTGSVTSSNDSIIQFMYGEENMDVSKLIKTKDSFSRFGYLKY